MKIHLVGGFLGSGKTTAITNSTHVLKSKGINAAVITNDQGNYLVDSLFINQTDIATGEVTGGCFCCNYDELDSQIKTLKDNNNPGKMCLLLFSRISKSNTQGCIIFGHSLLNRTQPRSKLSKKIGDLLFIF